MVGCSCAAKLFLRVSNYDSSRDRPDLTTDRETVDPAKVGLVEASSRDAAATLGKTDPPEVFGGSQAELKPECE